LKIIQNQHEKAIPFKKRRWLSIVAKDFTIEQLRSQGFKIERANYQKALKFGETVGAGEKVPAPKMPSSKQPKPEHVRKTLIKFLEEHSKFCPDRFVKQKVEGKKKKKDVPVLELEGFFPIF
jgi:hypothetical protein